MFALYDKTTGRIKQFQSCSDCPDEFTGAIDVSENLASSDMKTLGDTYTVNFSGLLQLKPPTPEPTKEEALAKLQKQLESARASALQQINSLVGYKRSEYITVIPGQEMTYIGKHTEAKEFVATLLPNLSNFPFVSADAQAFQVTPYEAAQTILNKADQWRQIGAYLESLRLTAIQNLGRLTTVAEIESALEQLKETLNV